MVGLGPMLGRPESPTETKSPETARQSEDIRQQCCPMVTRAEYQAAVDSGRKSGYVVTSCYVRMPSWILASWIWLLLWILLCQQCVGARFRYDEDEIYKACNTYAYHQIIEPDSRKLMEIHVRHNFQVIQYITIIDEPSLLV